MLRNGRAKAFDKVVPNQHSSPLLILGVFLLSRHTCCHPEHITTGVLYTTVKLMITLVRATGEVSLDLLRAQMLIAVYECAHGMAKQAHVTLSACVALLALIRLDMHVGDQATCSEEVMASLRAAIVMLDRMIPLSRLPGSLPLATPSKHSLSQSVSSGLEPCIPPPTPTPYASSPRKVHIRAMVSLASGRVLEHIHALHYGLEPDEDYDDIDASMSLVIKKLVDKPQPHTWLHCDAIAMAFWCVLLNIVDQLSANRRSSHLLLQKARIEDLKAKLIDPCSPEATKTMLALHYSRRMAWEMVHVMIGKIESEDELPQLPFAGLCCVIRAAVAVIETKEYEEEFASSDMEFEKFNRILSWFAARWHVGGEY
jgi:hypothetical protein